MGTRKTTPRGGAPLPAAEFQILLALFDRPRHGHGVRRHVAARTDDAVEIGPGTLYMAIKRMLESGLIVETDERPDGGETDERRRYYRITETGRKVARAEAERLRKLLHLAVDKKLLEGTGPA